MKRFFDFLILNILWIVFSIPLVTVGAATCASYYVNLKLVDEEDLSVVKLFFKGFKLNFKQGTVMWLFTVPCIYASYLLWQLILKAEDKNFFIIIGAVIYTLLIAIAVLYSYPIISRYYTKLTTVIKNCYGTALLYLTGTVIIFILVALELAVFFWNKYTMLAGIVIGPELIIYTISHFLKKVFTNIEESNSGKNSEEEED